MSSANQYDSLVGDLINIAADKPRLEIEEREVINLLEKIVGSHDAARDSWDLISRELHKRIVRSDYVIQWDMFRRVIKLSKLPTIEELQSACELYQEATPREIERRIQQLSGIEFETFLISILNRLPEYRELTATRQSHDEGVDLRGIFVPGSNSPQFVLIGQAKRVTSPVNASQARDFIGALHISGERGVVGLFVSTAGFTQPARDALEKCNVRVMQWDMAALVEHSKELVIKRVELSFGVPDNTFWDEVLGQS